LEKLIHTEENYGIRPQAQEFPMMCVLSFTYVCNAKCPNCPYTISDIRASYKDRPFMSEETFKIIADQCGEYGAYIRISGGGEPMLHPQAVPLMQYAKNKGAKVGLITNGSRFNEENTSALLQAGVDMIEFSVDAGDEDTYNIVRPGLDWNVLVNNVVRMRKMRNELKSQTRIIASIINQQGVDVEQAEKFWTDKVDTIQKRKFLTWGMGDPDKSADPTPYLEPEKKIPCPFIFERLNIDSRGNVMVCGYDIAANTNLGNIHEKSIKEIWHGNEFDYYRRMHLEGQGDLIDMCKECPDWKYRSWQHNYWKIEKKAEETRKTVLAIED
jgi:radical SAM protein with 4Fe4S-binding SPASM domain